MSVYEDRPIAKAIGSVGVAVLISVIIFIIVLDCQRIQQCFSKKKTNKSKKRKNNQVGTSDQNWDYLFMWFIVKNLTCNLVWNTNKFHYFRRIHFWYLLNFYEKNKYNVTQQYLHNEVANNKPLT